MTNNTLLLRQVSPKWVQEGRVTSQVFKPTPKDKKRLSVYDGDLIDPENAWRHYTGELGFPSEGVLAVTVTECQTLGLPAEPDPKPFPAHAVIRFDGCSASQIESKAKYLRKAAQARGWQYHPEGGE